MAYGGEQTITPTGWTDERQGRDDEPDLAKLSRITTLRYQISAEDTSPAGAAEAAFTNKLTIPADTLKAGDRILYRAKFKVLDQNGSDTLILRLRIGGLTGVVMGTVPSYDPADGDEHEIEGWLRVSSITAGVGLDKLRLNGVGKSVKIGGTAFLAVTSIDDDETLDPAVDIDIVGTYHWGASHADNDVRIKELSAEVFRTRQAWG